ncbi:hypothetical protein GCM10027036_40680 [Flavihumibacter cheonanensis]|uniref:hypothetical protein n=1 Tax=Flavihumibacter cheonanensis TaxID=1442385 RepID=UPI001EF7C856|nr:hypothetical protein [Flavihumibacter cheonanensis]MCG7754846.1 hypothetical protein [Flavihumibacter cheonanensis]
MSDHSISIVPRLSIYPDKEIKAKAILAWLVSLDIVKPTPSDCILSSNEGYPISQGAKNVSSEPDLLPFDLLTNGLEIITERHVFHTGQNGMEVLMCPNCKHDIANEDWDFLSEWSDNKSNNLTCPLCNIATDIHKFQFIPEWGFCNLGFTFWNWPGLKNSFINDFKQILGCDINVVYTSI